MKCRENGNIVEYWNWKWVKVVVLYCCRPEFGIWHSFAAIKKMHGYSIGRAFYDSWRFVCALFLLFAQFRNHLVIVSFGFNKWIKLNLIKNEIFFLDNKNKINFKRANKSHWIGTSSAIEAIVFFVDRKFWALKILRINFQLHSWFCFCVLVFVCLGRRWRAGGK